MNPIIFGANETVFTTQGYGVLTDAISCTVKEELNGAYELTLEYPQTGVWSELLVLRGIIVCKPNQDDGRQAFRIYNISEPLNDIITVNAQHISYDASGIPVEPFSVTGTVTAAMAGLREHKMVQTPITLETNLTKSGRFTVDVPSSLRSWFGGKDGALVNLFGGEWHYDNFRCRLLNRRGSDRGVTIRYGKNLTEYVNEVEDSSHYTAVWAYYRYEDSKGRTQIITSSLIPTGSYSYNKVLIVDASSDFGDSVPTTAQLNTYAQNYINSNGVARIWKNVTFDFVQLGGVAEQVALGDTVTLVYKGVDYSARIIEVEWDSLLGRYSNIVLGDAKESITSVIKSVNTSGSTMVISDSASETITGGSVIRTNNIILLHIDLEMELVAGWNEVGTIDETFRPAETMVFPAIVYTSSAVTQTICDISGEGLIRIKATAGTKNVLISVSYGV